MKLSSNFLQIRCQTFLQIRGKYFKCALEDLHLASLEFLIQLDLQVDQIEDVLERIAVVIVIDECGVQLFEEREKVIFDGVL